MSAEDALPVKSAVIVPAEKSPFSSLKTILLAVLSDVASLTCEEVILISTFAACVSLP